MLTLLYPSSVPAASVRDYLQTFLSDRRRFHSRRLLILLALLPPTAALCILPGPNPFLALWAFRAMGHWQARDGAKQMQLMLQEADADAEAQLRADPEAGAVPSASTANAAAAGRESSAGDVTGATPPVHFELLAYDAEGGETLPSLEQVCSQLELDQKAVETIIARWKID